MLYATKEMFRRIDVYSVKTWLEEAMTVFRVYVVSIVGDLRDTWQTKTLPHFRWNIVIMLYFL